MRFLKGGPEELVLVIKHSVYFQAGRSMSPNFLFVWPSAKIGAMEPQSIIAHMSEVILHGHAVLPLLSLFKANIF